MASTFQPITWLLRTVRLGYAIQFARPLPKYSGILFTSVQGENLVVLQGRNHSSSNKERNRACPSSQEEEGVLQPLLHCAQEGWWAQTDSGSMSTESVPPQAPVQYGHSETHTDVCQIPGSVCGDRLEGCVLDASILPRHRPFLRFDFEGLAYHYKVLPFRLSLSSPVFTKAAETALLRKVAICIPRLP